MTIDRRDTAGAAPYPYSVTGEPRVLLGESPVEVPARPGAGIRLRPARWLRLARVGLHLAQGLATLAWIFPFAGHRRRRAHVQRWSYALLEILDVRLHVRGMQPTLADAPLMLVSNHISWVDIFAINAVLPVRFVAKSEVRRWPVIGWLTERVGTLFIERERRREAALIGRRLTRLMQDGEPVAVFPEGTTTDGGTVLAFHASLIEPALRARATLRPVALRYACADGTPCQEAAFTGETSLWESLNLIVAQRGMRVELVFLSPLESHGRPRREVAHAARTAILQTLFP